MKKQSRRIVFFIFTIAASFIYAQKTSNAKISKTTPLNFATAYELQSEMLNEKRVLNIYFPEGYNTKDTNNYPVIYLLDGSMDEDFIHIVGLVQYNSFEWINIVQKSIVVGIATVDRRRDFTFPSSVSKDKERNPTSGHSDKFISFLENEVQAFVKNNFKTNNTKTIIGQSLGGLLATEILLKKPALFNNYIIVSPSLWWDNGSLLNYQSDITNGSFHQKTKIYIAVGKEGLTPTEIPRVMEVDVNLLAEKIKKTKSQTIQISFDYLPDENHATIMHQAVLNGFRALKGMGKE